MVLQVSIEYSIILYSSNFSKCGDHLKIASHLSYGKISCVGLKSLTHDKIGPSLHLRRGLC